MRNPNKFWAEQEAEDKAILVFFSPILLFFIIFALSIIFHPKTGSEIAENIGTMIGRYFLPWAVVVIFLYFYWHKQDKQKNTITTTSDYWFKKGLELSALNEYEKSLNAYNKALTFNDKDPDTWNNKSYVLIRLKKYDEAIKAGRIAVDLAPNDPEIQDTLNEAYKASKNQE